MYSTATLLEAQNKYISELQTENTNLKAEIRKLTEERISLNSQLNELKRAAASTPTPSNSEPPKSSYLRRYLNDNGELKTEPITYEEFNKEWEKAEKAIDEIHDSMKTYLGRFSGLF